MIAQAEKDYVDEVIEYLLNGGYMVNRTHYVQGKHLVITLDAIDTPADKPEESGKIIPFPTDDNR